MNLSVTLHAQADFFPQKELQYQLNNRLGGGVQSRPGRFGRRESSLLTGIRNPVHPGRNMNTRRLLTSRRSYQFSKQILLQMLRGEINTNTCRPAQAQTLIGLHRLRHLQDCTDSKTCSPTQIPTLYYYTDSNTYRPAQIQTLIGLHRLKHLQVCTDSNNCRSALIQTLIGLHRLKNL